MIVKKFDFNNGLTAKIFKTEAGYYHRIYFNKKEVAQMYYYSHTYDVAEENMYDMLETIDLEKARKLNG